MRPLLAALALLASSAALAAPATLSVGVVDDALPKTFTVDCPKQICATVAPITAAAKAHPHVIPLRGDTGFAPIRVPTRTTLKVTAAKVVDSPDGTKAVQVDLDPAAAQAFTTLTAASINKKLAIIVDGTAFSAPIVREKITGGRLMISLGATGDAAALLKALQGT